VTADADGPRLLCWGEHGELLQPPSGTRPLAFALTG
jgi:hypothetical protein